MTRVLLFVVCVTSMLCGGCAALSADTIREGFDIHQSLAALEREASAYLRVECVAPMELYAADKTGNGKENAQALDKKCKPKIAAYQGERSARLLLADGLTRAMAGKITMGDFVELVQKLVDSAGTLEKEISE